MSPSSNTESLEIGFYRRLLVLASLHSAERSQLHRIERLRVQNLPLSSSQGCLTQIERRELNNDLKLRLFLDSLAEICASTRNGSTVTAVTVHLPEGTRCPEYLFLSNQRDEKEAEDAKIYIESVLKTFVELESLPTPLKQQQHNVLRMALHFNRLKIQLCLDIICKGLRRLHKKHILDRICQFLFSFGVWGTYFISLVTYTNGTCLMTARRLLGRIGVVIPLKYLKNIGNASDDHCESIELNECSSSGS